MANPPCIFTREGNRLRSDLSAFFSFFFIYPKVYYIAVEIMDSEHEL